MTHGVATILLAAGGSTRMGRPKLLLPFAGTTLLRRAATAACDSDLRPAVAVVGPHPDESAAELRGLPIRPVTNANWEKGMGTSIRAGMSAVLEAEPDTEAVVITLADLPAVSSELLRTLVRAFRESGRAVVACAYAGACGVPALFSRPFFSALQSLPDSHGAKRLIAAAGEAVATVAFPGGAADIDTPADYRQLAGEAVGGRI